MEEKFLDSNINEDIYDTEVIIGSTPGGNLIFNKYREIMGFDENDEAITINNIFIWIIINDSYLHNVVSIIYRISL